MNLSRRVAVIVAAALLVVLLVGGVAFAYAPGFASGWCWGSEGRTWGSAPSGSPNGGGPATTVPGSANAPGRSGYWWEPGDCW